jgi:hypothetical protein
MSTYWVAFDLDQTIGCFESIHPYLTVFFPDVLQIVYRKPYYKGPGVPVLDISSADKKRLALAFNDFVKWMAATENENKLLRPGIIPIISLLLKAKKRGLVGGIMIYSNNSNPYMLHFAHELIKTILGIKTAIFCPLVHWWHSLRNKELRGNVSFSLSHGPKTVSTIRAAFTNIYCINNRYNRNNRNNRNNTSNNKNIEISSANIIFFDDLIHERISNKIPTQNYFHVQPYHRYADILKIHICFLNALMIHDLDKNKGLLDEYKKIGLSIGPSDEHINSFRAQTPVGDDVNVADSEKLLWRLAKLLKTDIYYNMVEPQKITISMPVENPFEKPKMVVIKPTLVTRYTKRGGKANHNDFSLKRKTRRSTSNI